MNAPYPMLIRRYLKAKYLGTPLTANFKVTERCNLTCPMCGIPRFGDRGREMGVPQIRDMAAKLNQLSVARVVVTGGEPMLRDDLEEIVAALSREGLFVSLLTNGSLSSRDRIRRLVGAGINALGVSLDTLDENWMDEFCGAEGTWRKAFETLQDGVDLLPSGMVYAMCTLSRENLEEAPKVVDFVERELGAYTVVNPINLPVSGDEERRLSMHKPELQVSEEEKQKVDRVYGELLRMKKAGRPMLVSSHYLELSREYLKTNDPSWSCDAGTIYFNISSDGAVGPCNEFPGFINVQDPDFVSRIRGDAWADAAKKQRDACSGCVFSCWREMSALVKEPSVLLEQTRTLMKRRPRRPDREKATA